MPRKPNKTLPEDIKIEPRQCQYCGEDIKVTLYYVRDQRYTTRQYISESRTRYEYGRRDYCSNACRQAHKKALTVVGIREQSAQDAAYNAFCFGG